MPGLVEKALVNLGITLPTPAAPIANYVAFVRTGNVVTVSGQLCFGSDGKLAAKGQLGGGVSVADGQKAARACAVNLLAQIKAAIGDLDRIGPEIAASRRVRPVLLELWFDGDFDLIGE